MKFFHGINQPGPYFEGWYLKHQSKDGRVLALIPAFHIDPAGRRSASLQVISEEGSWWLEYPDKDFSADPERFRVRVGRCCFCRRGARVEIDREGLSLRGTVHYGPFTPLGRDIMGPFRLFGGMQCSHGVLSMGHGLRGRLELNGEILDFSDGLGYIETDRGRSFPDRYLWTQCGWKEGGLMLAIATIPLPIGGFTGCICAILHRGREYRLATYRGAKIVKWSPAGAEIRQGKYRLTVELLEEQARPLHAPTEGRMERTIHESLCARVRYSLWRGRVLLLRHNDRCASFEYSDRKQATMDGATASAQECGGAPPATVPPPR